MSRPLAISSSPVVVASVAVVVALATTLGVPRAARANGAFPESYQLVLPLDRPDQIVLATNFGLIISDDGGATWTWTCEQKETTNGTLYGVSAPPLDRLFSMSTLVGLAYSDDGSCGWTSSGGMLDQWLATDYFPDPTNVMRVYAVASLPSAPTMPPEVFSSDDGGKTFGAALFTAPAGSTIVGVESARSDPKTIYVSTYTTTGFHPTLWRSIDGGASWTPLDVERSLGANPFRIIAVDPVDARVVSVRVFGTTGESLAVSRDGGATFTKVVDIAGQLTGYVLLDSGTILVSGALATEGVGFQSKDGGKTFVPWTPQTTDAAGVPDVAADGGVARPPHLRALAARGGKLYAAAKNFSDDWAVGVSTDDGVTIKRVTRYDQVQGIRACAKATCQDSCDFQAGKEIWAASVCNPEPPEGAEAPVEPPAPPAGCGCRMSDALGPASAVISLAALCLAAARGLPRRRRPRSRG